MRIDSRLRSRPIVEFFAVPFRLRTYGSLLYLWLAFPLGLVYFVGLTVGFAAGVPLTLVWVGLLLLFLTMAGAWLAQGLERQLAIHLLGAAVPERLDPARPVNGKRLVAVRAVGSSAALWKGLVFLFLKFPLGLVGWVISLVTLIVPVAFVAAPFALLFGRGHVELGVWTPTTFVGALPLAFAGALALLLSLHLHNALGLVWARLAEGLLGARLPESNDGAVAPAVAA